MRKLVLFTGGGTGGHVFPGIAVIERLRTADQSLEFLWLGTGSDLEVQIARRFSVPYRRIPAGKLRRYLSLRNVADLARILAGLAASLIILAKVRPSVLFSKGGYVSVPPVVAARILRIPVVTHESDLDPGLATRLNARFAETICVAYEESKNYFPAAQRRKIVVTGNPVRSEVLSGNRKRGRGTLKIGEQQRVILALGGSQGAREINLLIEAILERLPPDVFVVHQSGTGEPFRSQNYHREPFFAESYADTLAAADLVVCRSGAGTLWDLAAQGRPSILIPLGTTVSRGDQIGNAELFATRGAAVVLASGGTDPGSLLHSIERLFDEPERLSRMGLQARSILRGDASQAIAELVIQHMGATGAFGDN